MPGATVTITGPQGSQTFTADAEGRFNAPFLTPGTYAVRAELQGFKASSSGTSSCASGSASSCR